MLRKGISTGSIPAKSNQSQHAYYHVHYAFVSVNLVVFRFALLFSLCKLFPESICLNSDIFPLFFSVVNIQRLFYFFGPLADIICSVAIGCKADSAVSGAFSNC